MTNPSPNPKALLRKQFRDALNAMAEHQRLVGSRQICTLLRESDFWQQSQAVLAFAPLPTEPDIRPLWSDALAHGKILYLPRFDSATDAYAAAQVLDPDHDLVLGALELLDLEAVAGAGRDRAAGVEHEALRARGEARAAGLVAALGRGRELEPRLARS